MYVQIIYESRAPARISDQDIAEITAKAIPHNQANGLTGFLYYDDTRFLHVIEGSSVLVAKTMQRIIKDPLHHTARIRLMNHTAVRSFASWPFGTVSVDDPELRRIVRNMGFKDLFQANVLVATKVLKRVSNRKYRVTNTKENMPCQTGMI